MSELNQKLGFDASAAIKNLALLATQLGTTGAALAQFGQQAKAASVGSFSTQMKTAAGAAGKATQALDKAGKAAETTGKKFKKTGVLGSTAAKKIAGGWGIAVRIVATQLFTRALGSMIQMFQQAVESARQFGIAISEVATISGKSLGDQQRLSQAVLDLSDAYGKAAKDVAEGLYQTLSNQVADASQAFVILEQSMKLAVATGAETKDAINAISSVINSYGESAGDAARISDQLFKTVELGRLRLNEIGNIMGRVTPLAAKLGISFKELAATIAVQTRQGVQANTALTQTRSVIQKLIKPTDKLKAVFHQWGVADGPTAIKTFGGYAGVLKKLAKEVNNNDAEMAQFFTRVRAIAAQMSTMTKNGEVLEDVINKIGEATGATNKAFAEFEGSPAFELTKAQNEFNNELIRTGQELTNIITLWTRFKTDFVTGIRVLFNGLDNETELSDARVRNNALETADRIKKINEQNTDNVTEELNKQVAEHRKAATNVQKMWQASMANAKLQFAQVSNLVKTTFKQTQDELKGSLTPLSDFVKNISSELRASADSAQDMREELNQRQFDRQVDKASPERAFRKRFNFAAETFQKAREQLDKATTRDQRETAEKTFEAARAEADRALKVAETNKSTRSINSINNLIDESLKKQIKSMDQYNARTESRAETAKAAELEINQIVERREVIAKRIVKLYSDFASNLDPKARAETVKEINQALSQLKKLDISADAGAFMDSLNIPNVAKETGDKIQERLDRLFINTDKLIGNISQQLKQDKAAQEKALPGGVSGARAADRLLGTTPKLLESPAVRFNDVLNKGIDLKQESANASKNLAIQEQLRAQATFASQESINNLERVAAKEINRRNAETGEVGVGTHPELTALAESYAKVNETIQAGGTVAQQRFDQLERDTQAALRNKIANGEQAKSLKDSLNAVKQYKETSARAGELEADILPADKIKEVAKETEAAATAGEGFSNAMESGASQTSWATEKASELTTATGHARDAANDVATGWKAATAAVTATTQAAVLAIQQVAQAKAAAAAAVTAYQGGRIDYLAQGGQGQDTINAKLAPGEFVSSASVSRKFFSELNAMNNGGQPVYREQGGPITNVGDVNVTVQGGDTSQATVREIGYGLRRDIRRGVTTLG